MAQDGLNNGDNTLGYDADDTHCPQCGRETCRTLFTIQAFCEVCDSPIGWLKVKLGIVPDPPAEQD